MKLPPWIRDWHIYAATIIALLAIITIFYLLISAVIPDAGRIPTL